MLFEVQRMAFERIALVSDARDRTHPFSNAGIWVEESRVIIDIAVLQVGTVQSGHRIVTPATHDYKKLREREDAG